MTPESISDFRVIRFQSDRPLSLVGWEETIFDLGPSPEGVRRFRFTKTFHTGDRLYLALRAAIIGVPDAERQGREH